MTPNGGGFSTLLTTDAITAGGTPFARTGVSCAPSGCAAGATVNGSTAETGVTLTSGKPTGSPSGSVTVQAVTYAASLGSLTLTDPLYNTPATITGASPAGGLAGTFTVTAAGYGPTAVAIDATGNDGTHFSASLSNGVTTITASGGIAATIAVDANGNGTVTYSDGSFERVIDYRDLG